MNENERRSIAATVRILSERAEILERITGTREKALRRRIGQLENFLANKPSTRKPFKTSGKLKVTRRMNTYFDDPPLPKAKPKPKRKPRRRTNLGGLTTGG